MVANIQANDSDSVTLKQLFDVIRSGKWTIVLVTLAFTVTAGAAAWLLPKRYEANAVVAALSSNSGGALGGLSSFASQLGGLASLAGINVGTDEKKSQSIAVLQSAALTEAYIRQNNLLPVLYESSWDAARGTWKPMDADRVPTLWKANQFFKKSVRRIKTDSSTGLVTVTVTWTDPKLAAQWANGLVDLANDYLRAKAIEESEANISYLNKEAAQTELVGARQAIYAILQNEINKAMLARGSAEYAFKIIDPAKAPELASSPQKLLWLIAGFAMGMVLSVFFVLVRASWNGAN